jgi:hypothetical protein
MKPDINCILAGFNFKVTNYLKHSALTFGLSSGAMFIFDIKADATGF